MKTIKVIYLEDSKADIDLVQELTDQYGHISILDINNTSDLVTLLPIIKCDAVLLDLHLGEQETGIAICQMLLNTSPSVKVIIYSHLDPQRVTFLLSEVLNEDQINSIPIWYKPDIDIETFAKDLYKLVTN